MERMDESIQMITYTTQQKKVIFLLNGIYYNMWGSHPKIFGIKGCSDELWIKYMNATMQHLHHYLHDQNGVCTGGGSGPQSGTFITSAVSC